MNPQLSPIAFSGYNLGDVFNLTAPIDLLDDEDFESTMLMMDCPALRRGVPDTSELGLPELNDTFNAHDAESLHATNGQHLINAHGPDKFTGFNPYHISDMKIQSSSYAGFGADALKQEAGQPGCSPLGDPFFRGSWDNFVGTVSRPVLSSLTPASGCLSPISIWATPGRVAPLPLDVFLPNSLPLTPPTLRSMLGATSSLPASSSSSTQSKSTRRTKQCMAVGCTRRAQSNDRCKTHGGGARCQVESCSKSSQGGGLCRAHGGGKKCRVSGCSKGTQRHGLCYVHGGIRRCIMEGCVKKDRGNGYCISHGGGRRCEVGNCNRSVRKGNHCQLHQNIIGDNVVLQLRY